MVHKTVKEKHKRQRRRLLLNSKPFISPCCPLASPPGECPGQHTAGLTEQPRALKWVSPTSYQGFQVRSWPNPLDGSFYKRAQLCPFIYTLSMAAFLPKWQCKEVATRDQMAHRAENVCSLALYRKKFAGPHIT